MKYVIIGGKGTAVNIAEQIEDARQRFGAPVEVLGFAIDDPSLGSAIAGFPVLCGTRDAASRYPHSDVGFIFSLYKPSVMRDRVRLLRSFEIPLDRFATFVHPQAYFGRTAEIGSGAVVLSQATVQSQARIGAFSLINSQVVIEHETIVGECNFIAASACLGAAVVLGEGVFVGLGAQIRENVTIGDYGFVGMGSVVVKCVPLEAVVVGNPARELAR